MNYGLNALTISVAEYFDNLFARKLPSKYYPILIAVRLRLKESFRASNRVITKWSMTVTPLTQFHVMHEPTCFHGNFVTFQSCKLRKIEDALAVFKPAVDD